jgi:hypothetical protein
MIKLSFRIALLLTACWVMLFFAMGYKPLKALPDVLVLHVSDPLNADTEHKVHSIHSKDLVHEQLKRLVVDDGNLWEPQFVSYVAASIQFIGEGVSISCYPDLMVLDYFKFGSWWSYKKRVLGLLAFLVLPKSKSTAPMNDG